MLKAMARAGFAVVALFLASTVWAQGGSSVISGTVFDGAQAVLPGVSVTVTNEATGISREAVTGELGRFVVPTLQPGTYTVRAELTGFQSVTQQGVVLQVGQELSLDFTLGVATLAETVTVTAQTPVVETTATRIGSTISNQEIDTLPTQGRNHFSLMQLVPGLTPNLDPGEFEGGNYNANGRGGAQNQFNTDGAGTQDPSGGANGPQARVTLDSMAEFQVLTHQYNAEYGGSSGVIVNAVTKSGTNDLAGRGFYYFEDSKLRANDPFAEAAGEPKPDSGKDTYGFNVGGPVLRDKAFFFFNLERNLIEHAVVHTMPPSAAPLAVSYADATLIRSLNTFVRGDYTAGQNRFSFKWITENGPVIGEDFECCQTLDNRVLELDFDNTMYNADWTWVIGNRATNELRWSNVREDRVSAGFPWLGVPEEDWKKSGWISGLEHSPDLGGRDPFEVGWSTNEYADFTTGPAPDHSGTFSQNIAVSNFFTYITSDTAHSLKAGVTYNYLEEDPARVGTGMLGIYSFRHNLPFNPANPLTYPSQFEITLGDPFPFTSDTWINGYVQDQWRATSKLTLNLGLRYDYQELTPQTKNAFAPRLGLAYDPTGTGGTVFRGGVGKFYEYHFLGTAVNLNRRGVLATIYNFDTGEDRSADRGVIPTSHVCLRPALRNGLAVIAPACRAVLVGLRNQLQPGASAAFVNPEPIVDGNREMGYLWSFSAGVERQLIPNLSVSVDYVGNRAGAQSGLIDISEGPVGPNGRITRLRADQFDPTGTLIPTFGRNVAFGKVLQYQTRDDLKSDFDSMEVSLEKRYSNRWSGRAAYTLAYANDTGAGGRAAADRYASDLNPSADYGRASFDNRHAFTAGGNMNVWRGFNIGAVYRYYSGYPINETIGTDVNGDRDNNDRPVRGIHDAVRPILSEVDASGRAVRNGIDGEKTSVLDLQMRYVVNLPRTQTIGFFWELYNALNTVNLGNPIGNRNNRNFLVPTEAAPMRSMQLGVRYTF
jgi:hypothetical protein